MKHHIFMLAMMLQAIAIHAQNEHSIQQLMDYLEQMQQMRGMRR